MDFKSLFTVLFIGFFVVITPGPNLAIVLKNSLSGKSQYGIMTALGLALGNFIHITYCLIGIGVIISQSLILFNIIKIIGALYLIYLGLKMIVSKNKEEKDNNLNNKNHTLFNSLKNGFFTDLLNPKATLFFLALFTQIIRPESMIYERIIYGSSIVLMEFIYFSAISLIVGHKIIHTYINKFIHSFEKATGFILISLGIKIILFNDSK